MSSKTITRRISIFINGKEVKNNLSSVGKAIGKLRGQIKHLTPGTEKFIKKTAELRKARKHYADLNKEIKGTESRLNRIKKALGPIGPMILAAFSITAVLAFFKTIINGVSVLRKLKGTISQITDLQGEDLDRVTSKAKAMADAFESDTKKMSESANNLSKTMGIDFMQALDLIEQGFLDGADANGDFLDKVREYPVLLKEAGFSAEQSIALMSQEIKQGIYSDKGVDAIKEANLRLREMTPSAEAALNAIGLSSKNIQKELVSGSKTTFEIMQKVSKQMASLPPQSKVVGQAIADIFGGPGEDAGIKYLSNLHNIDLSLNSITSSSNKYTQAKKLEVDANEALNNVWVKLTGTGSSLSLLYSSFKLGLADLLGALTGVKNESLAAEKAFANQAKKIVSLESDLVPLIEEYENLSTKTNLSEGEQTRLKTVIGEIGDIIPTAISAFDKYGNAITISTGVAKDFIKTQKILLKHKNAVAIDAEIKKLKELEDQIKETNKALNYRNKQGKLVKDVRGGRMEDFIKQQKELTSIEIKELQARQKELQKQEEAHKIIKDNYTGDYLDKFIKSETTITEKTAEEIAARKLLEETASKHKIKNIESLTDTQLQIEITKAIERNNKLVGIRKKNAKIIADLEQKKQQEIIASRKRLAAFILEFKEEQELLEEIIKSELTDKEEAEELLRLEAKYLKMAEDAGYETILAAGLKEAHETAISTIEKKHQDKRIKVKLAADKKYQEADAATKKKLIAAETKLENAKRALRATGINGLKSMLGQHTAAYKFLFGLEKALAINTVLVDSSKAVAQITANTAVANIKAIATSPLTAGQPFVTTNTILGAKAALTTKIQAATQIASIVGSSLKGFYFGGHTGSEGPSSDEYGKITGYTHPQEYVTPAIIAQDPYYAPEINKLENARQEKLGISDGETTESSDNESTALLTNAVYLLLDRLDEPIEAVANIGDDKIMEQQARLQKLNNSRKNAKIK